MNHAKAKLVFEAYYQKRVSLASAVLPEDKLSVLRRMEQEFLEDGAIPVGEDRVAEFNPKHPVFVSILAGEVVNVSGEVSGKSKGLVGASTGVKLAIMGGIFLIPVLIGISLLFLGGGDEPIEESVIALVGEGTIMPTETLLPTATFTPVPTVAPVVIVANANPIETGPEATPSEAEIQGIKGSVAPSQGDPASIEFAGRSFILATGETKNGVWSPKGAEWLVGTNVRRVIAIPSEDSFEVALTQISDDGFRNERIQLRLRSGEVVIYKVDEIAWYRRDQIEVLTSSVPSVVIVLSQANALDQTRLIISGIAEQSDPIATQ
jgi:hypothetical protein